MASGWVLRVFIFESKMDKNMNASKLLMVLPLVLLACTAVPQSPIPEKTVFKLTRTDGGDVPQTLVFDYQGAGPFVQLKVETELKGWTVDCDAPWCTVVADAIGIRFNVQPYQGESKQLFPRTCKVHIQAGAEYENTLTLGQESEEKFLYTVPGKNWSAISLPAAGAPVEVLVVSNLVDWTIRNVDGWVKADKIDRTTLRLSVIPSETEHKRTGQIVLESVANEVQSGSGPAWTLYLREEDAGGTSDDYTYGDNLE